MTGGGGVYADPAFDEQEEAVEVVEAFFKDSKNFEAELKRTYAKRRKAGSGGDVKKDNW